jgi:LysR family transcriptional regulator, nitrogen assimilation regulatory protein
LPINCIERANAVHANWAKRHIGKIEERSYYGYDRCFHSADRRPAMIELRNLAYFVVACQHASLARAANQLGIALSTLSVSLKALEDALGLELFRRTSAGLYPTTAARWLVRAVVPILLTEVFARRIVTARTRRPAHILTVEVSLNFTLGRISKAILRASETMAAERAEILIDPVWVAEKGMQPVHGIADGWSGVQQSRMGIHASDDRTGPAAGETLLLSDPWVLACRLPASTQSPTGAAELFAGPVMIPALPPPLSTQVADYCATHELRNVRFIDEHPGALPRLFDQHPETAFFVPESVLSSRLGLLRLRTSAPDSPLTATIVARADQSDGAAALFIRHLRAALAQAERVTAQRPALSLRQIRYFNMVHRLRRVSAAAHGANVAQPALSEQLRKLETALGGRLFERHSDGLVPTPAGERFAPIARVIEAHMREIAVGGTTSFVPTAKRLALGILPSVSQHGLLVNKISEAVLDVQARYPALQVVVREAPNRALQDWVVRGVVGVAIVETSLPQMARLTLGSSEALAVIANPRHGVLARGPVRLAQLADLPLALPTTQFGLRQLLDAAAQDHGITIKPRVEIDALTMMAAVLERQPLCTVLPPSAVRRELAAGELTAHPIVEPTIARRLFMIYSADRSLTEAERDLVQLLRARLADEEPLTVGRAMARRRLRAGRSG